MQTVLFEKQLEAVELIPEQGPSAAVIVAHESIVPVKAEQFEAAALHPIVPFQTQFLTLLIVGSQVSQEASVVAVVFNTQVLTVQVVVDMAAIILVHGPSEPVKFSQIVRVP